MTMSGDASVSLEMSCSSSFSSVDGNRQLQTSQTSQYYGSEDIAEDGSKNLTSDHNIATQIPLNEEIFTPSSLAAKTKRPLQEQAKDNTDLCLLDNNDTPKKRLRSSTRLIVEKHRREETKQQKEKEKEERKLQRELEKNQRLQERELKKKVLEEEKRLREEKREQEILKRKAEKEAKEREREEKKRILEMEREEKRKAQEKEREEKKKSIEAEKLKKEEEKRKKENSQLKLGNFFTVKKIKPQESQSSENVNTALAYDKHFLDFYLKEGTSLADIGALSPNSLKESVKRIDAGEGPDLIEWIKGTRRTRGTIPKYTTADVVQAMNSGDVDEHSIRNMIKSIPQHYIYFWDNIRPSVISTFSNVPKGGIPRNNPYFTEGTGLNYEYDSDLEWGDEDEGEGEGEDLDNEDKESDDELNEIEEMDEFVAYDDISTAKRRIIGPLVPIVKWNDGSDSSFYEPMEIESLCENVEGSIDPFKDYWSNVTKDSELPSIPKVTVNMSPIADLSVASQTTKSEVVNTLQPRKKPKSLITDPGHLLAFAKSVEGSDFNQIVLVEILKREFTTYSKETIRNTLKEIGLRVGSKESEKKWVIKPDILKKLHSSVNSKEK